ncbi:MAG: hypothetical protein HYZ18_06935 [Pseudogulbenkiania sp.]|nr:hypothetical protein [Pseudogulbenkiania sp.]
MPAHPGKVVQRRALPVSCRRAGSSLVGYFLEYQAVFIIRGARRHAVRKRMVFILAGRATGLLWVEVHHDEACVLPFSPKYLLFYQWLVCFSPGGIFPVSDNAGVGGHSMIGSMTFTIPPVRMSARAGQLARRLLGLREQVAIF